MCGVGAVVAAPLVLTAAGFTSAGIAGGSLAASMMSASAIANGGGVAAGSLVAVLQSAGAVGLGAAGAAAVGSAGAAVGVVAGTVADVVVNHSSSGEPATRDAETQVNFDDLIPQLDAVHSGHGNTLNVLDRQN